MLCAYIYLFATDSSILSIQVSSLGIVPLTLNESSASVTAFLFFSCISVHVIYITHIPLIFLFFFAAYYIIFLSFDNPNTPEGVDDSVSNPMPSPMESVMAMFLMSMTNFGDYYGAFERTEHEMLAKVGVM